LKSAASKHPEVVKSLRDKSSGKSPMLIPCVHSELPYT